MGCDVGLTSLLNRSRKSISMYSFYHSRPKVGLKGRDRARTGSLAANDDIISLSDNISYDVVLSLIITMIPVACLNDLS